MIYSPRAVTAFLLTVGGVAAFSGPPSAAFVSRRAVSTQGSLTQRVSHGPGCSCPACLTSFHPAGCSCSACAATMHSASCSCPSCARRGRTVLFAETLETTDAEDVVPAEVEALDGIESPQEAHNTERPARESLKKKRGNQGLPLEDFSVGSSVTGKVKAIANYGAFVDIGATTDGLLHISQLSQEFVSDVSEVLEVGQEVEVRIVNIDAGKNQVALSLLTQEQADAASKPRQQRERRGGDRRDDSAALRKLTEATWDTNQFVEGTVVSTVDFGAFVKIDLSQLNSEVQGEVDGLVHISALAAGRVGAVTDICNVDDKVQVRLKAITGKKVSLSMVSPEDEQQRADSAGPQEGAKDWKESLEKIQGTMPAFKNGPSVVDLRK